MFHLNFVFMGPSQQASPSWCATFCRRALHDHWVVSARCWTRPCGPREILRAVAAGWVWTGSKNRRSPATFQKTNQWTWIFAVIWRNQPTFFVAINKLHGPWWVIYGGKISPSLPTGFQPFFQPFLSPSKAGIWDWLQEEAPQMLPSLLALVRQALPPAPEAAVFLGQVKQRKRNLLVS